MKLMENNALIKYLIKLFGDSWLVEETKKKKQKKMREQNNNDVGLN